MHRNITALLLAIVVLLVLVPQAVLADGGTTTSHRVVFILMDNLSWPDLVDANDPTINKLIENGSIGILNNRPNGALSRPRATLSAGAGTRGEGDGSSFEGYNAEEPYGDELAMDAYWLRTGKSAKKGQVLELGIAPIIRANFSGTQDFVAGQLADVIEAAGGKTAVFGNSDTSIGDQPGSTNREIVGVAMNSNGIVSFGDVGKDMLTKDTRFPFGIRTDYAKLLTQLNGALGKADFVAIDLGDTVRADFYQGYAFKNLALKYRRQAIHQAGTFIKQAMLTTGDNTTFIIASLSPPGSSKYALKGSLEQMTPVIVYGPGFSKGGLVSNTSHRDGLVSIIDIAPTALDVLGLQRGSAMTGSPMRTGSPDVTLATLNTFNQTAIDMRVTRRVGVLAFIYIQIALLILAAVVLASRRALNKTFVWVLETLIFTTMSYPLFSFYATKLPALVGLPVVVTLLTIIVSFAFAAFLVSVRRDVLHPIIGVALLNVVIISTEVLLGGPSFINSIFGYDPMRGARFFGIGNEAMSMLVANGLLLFGIMLEKAWNRWTVFAGIVLSAVITVLIGFPGLGTNTDGPLTSTAAFTIMVLLALRSRAKLRNFAIAAGAVIVVLALFAGYDATHGATTHMGRSVLLIASGGFSEVLMIVKRKLATNLLILRYSTWSYFLFIVIGLLAFLWFKPAGVLRELLENYRGMSAAISASIVGGIVGFAFNDSGILIPALIMAYTIPTVIYLMLWRQYHSAE